MTYYFYDPETKALTPAKRVLDIGGAIVANPAAGQYAALGGDDPEKGAYPLQPSPAFPDVPEGKIAIPDGYKLEDGSWTRTYRIEDAPPPALADYDEAMEAHLRREREDRGYTTREPDAYLTSSDPRWSTDAMDWVAHRDDVMKYAQDLMNAVASGSREAPTMEEFKAGLPAVEWTYGSPEDSSSGGSD